VSATVVTKERESGNLAVLAATGFPARSVLAGKLVATAWHLRALLAVTLLRMLILGAVSPVRCLGTLLLFAVSLTALACVAQAAAAVVPFPKAGVAAGFIAAAALWAGPSLLEAFGLVPELPRDLPPWGMLMAMVDPDRAYMGWSLDHFFIYILTHSLIATCAFATGALTLERRSRA
jgi:hypothetical protein